jgi:glycine oxidase
MMNVVVLGAGVMGTALAWRLQQLGAHAIVLERALPGAEASSAAAGILAPLAEAAGEPHLLELGVASLARYPEWAEALLRETGVDVGFRRCGVLHVALDPAGVAQHDATQAALGAHRHERVTGSEAAARWPWLGPVHDALWLPTEAVVDNRLLVQALYRAAERAGATFVTGRTALGIATEGGRAVGIETDQGTVRGDAVALCAGAWTSLVPEAAALGIKPIRGQMLAVKAPAPPIPTIVFAARRGYLVPRDDGRVIVGSTMEDAGFEKAVTPEGLRLLGGLVMDVVPSLSRLPVVETWAGFRPASADGMPALGRLGPEGLWVASGHHRNGILLTPITAEILAARILGKEPPVSDAPFDPRRFA